MTTLTNRIKNFTLYSFLTILFLALTGFAFTKGNDKNPQETVYSLHAKYIYHFTKYFEWPGEKQIGPFIIGIYNNHDLYTDLKKIADVKKINNRIMMVMELNPEDDPGNCQMLFIGRSALPSIDKIVLKTANKSVILLSDKMGFLKKGIDINFIIKDEMLRFELGTTSLDSKKIKIANEIKALALSTF